MAKYGSFECEVSELRADFASGDIVLSLKVPKDHMLLVRRIFGESLGKKLIASIADFKKKRSLDANAYMWSLCGDISAKTGVPKNEVYRRNIKEVSENYFTHLTRNDTIDAFEKYWSAKGIGWLIEIVDESPQHPGYSWVNAFYGSSHYDTAQMSRLIDNVIQDAKAVGVETLTPLELERLKDEWR